jgi:ferrous iron transport protein B
MRLLEEDPYFLKKYRTNEILKIKDKISREIARNCGQDPALAFSSERHAKSLDIFEACAKVKTPQKDFREDIDNVLMHPIWGYVFLVFIMYAFFQLVFKFGGYLEGPLLSVFDGLIHQLEASMGTQSIWAKLLEGVIQGFSGGIAIVLPYLLPFLLGLSILEDLGYLPRVAYLTDIFMHKIGLHGKSVIPFILGYGCSVPAVMATRILESRREGVIASILAVMVPCSARSTVIFGLVAYYVGPNAALGIYVLNIFVIALAGKIMTRLMPEEAPGLILEVPAYRLPSWRVLLLKTWFRLREFIYVAWPILIVGSVVLSLIEFAHWDLIINNLLYPITYALSLPKQVGVTLIFGILRKELSLIMLMQALGTNQLGQALSHLQMMTFTIFVVFYIPCAATIGVLWKEIGGRWPLFTILFTTGLALFLALLTKYIWLLFAAI